MATSGLLNTTAWKGTYGNRYLELAWERTAFSVVDQTTTIKWTLTSRGTYTGYVMSAPFNVVIDGEQVFYSEERIKLYSNQEIATGEKVIRHNSDGTRTFAAAVQAALYYSTTNATGSNVFTLDLVGMATISKAPNFTDEDNPTIEYYNPVGDAITSLQAAISLTGADVDIAYRAIPIESGSYTFNLTDAERAILRAATQGSNTRKVRFYLRNVVEGNIYFSWKEVNYTVINAIPYIVASVVDTNTTTTALTGDNSTLIRYHSTAYAAMSATAYKEATIKTRTIEHNGGLTSNSTLTVSNVEGNTFAFIVSDSRGNTATKTIVAPMIDYIKPTANIDNTQQMDTDGNYTLTVSGNYYNDTFGYTSAAVANYITVAYRYKAQGGSWGSWSVMTETLNGNTYTATQTVSGLDYRTAYVFQCFITDRLNTVYSAEITVRSLPLFHWGENDFTFEVPVNFNAGANGISGGSGGECAIVDGVYDGDLKITGNLRLKGSGNYGNKINFGDGEYTYIEEPTDDNLTIKATTINLDGLLKYKDNSIEYGSWVPELNISDAVASYTTQWGWYQKLGMTVVIGFHLKAEINAGYSGNTISISGCPFTPVFSAFGGGIAHNIAFSAGHCFEGWAIGTDGLITPRGQPCNNTTLTNLNITSTAYYPTGNNTTTMTLGGTISFMPRG